MSKAAAAALAASVAKGAFETVIEYVLSHHKDEENVQPLVSDHDLEYIQHEKHQHVTKARVEGRARPDLRITKRVAKYPLTSQGKRMAEGSSVTETEV